MYAKGRLCYNIGVEQKKPSQWWRSSLIYILILFAILALAFSFIPISPRPEKVDLYAFIGLAKQDRFDTILQDGEIIIGLKNDKEIAETGYIGTTDDLINTLEKSGITIGENGVKIDVKSRGFDWGSLAISFVPLILFAALLFFVFRSYRKKA
jgi:cell division protease FtsH